MSQLTDALLDSGIFAWMECFFCFCVCVCPTLFFRFANEFVGEVCACRFLNELAEGAGGTNDTGTNKDAHQMPVQQRATLRCVPATCDILHSHSTSGALLPY